jgi:hypothetical protein
MRLLIGMVAFAASACSQSPGSDAANASGGNRNVTGAPATAAAPTSRPAAQAPARGVDDPRAFVEQRYQAYMRGPEAPVDWPTFAYSGRLKGLFDAYDHWSHQHEDVVGALDFDWWINAQDWELHDVTVTEADRGPDAKTVTARFRNTDRREEIRFLFVRQNGRWYLDDAVQGSGHGDDGWTLSDLLRSREE